jgi:protein subunit release factor B
LGQHINKVSTQVTIRHVPTGNSVTSSDSRSQSMNRQLALIRLFDEMDRRKAAKRQERLAELSTKRKMVEGKRLRGETKKLQGRFSA